MGDYPVVVKSNETGCVYGVGCGCAAGWLIASNDNCANPAEMRLYIDSGFTVTPMPIGLGMGEEDEVRRGLLRLAEVVNLTVHEVTVEKDASLSLSFYGDVFLHVSGQPASWTTHDVWWLAAGCR